MKTIITLLALALSTTLLAGCNEDSFEKRMEKTYESARESHRILDEINAWLPKRAAPQPRKRLQTGSEIYKEAFGKYPGE